MVDVATVNAVTSTAQPVAAATPSSIDAVFAALLQEMAGAQNTSASAGDGTAWTSQLGVPANTTSAANTATATTSVSMGVPANLPGDLGNGLSGLWSFGSNDSAGSAPLDISASSASTTDNSITAKSFTEGPAQTTDLTSSVDLTALAVLFAQMQAAQPVPAAKEAAAATNTDKVAPATDEKSVAAETASALPPANTDSNSQNPNIFGIQQWAVSPVLPTASTTSSNTTAPGIVAASASTMVASAITAQPNSVGTKASQATATQSNSGPQAANNPGLAVDQDISSTSQSLTEVPSQFLAAVNAEKESDAASTDSETTNVHTAQSNPDPNTPSNATNAVAPQPPVPPVLPQAVMQPAPASSLPATGASNEAAVIAATQMPMQGTAANPTNNDKLKLAAAGKSSTDKLANGDTPGTKTSATEDQAANGKNHEAAKAETEQAAVQPQTSGADNTQPASMPTAHDNPAPTLPQEHLQNKALMSPNPLSGTSTDAPKLQAEIQVSAQGHNSDVATSLDKLGVAIATSSSEGNHQFDIRLDPAELGRVHVHLTVDEDGKAQANLIVDKPQTLELLQRDASSLNRALQDAGLNLSQSGLNFSLREQNRQNDNGGGEGRGRSLSAKAVLSAEATQSRSSQGSYAPNSVRLDIRV